MISIDTVYQRVQALANKEQRGYITPVEFNLFANQAQMDMFEQYFYDLTQARRLIGNDIQYSDLISIIEEKTQVFEAADGPAIINDNTIYVGAGGGGVNKRLPDYVYRVNRVELNGVECELMNTQKFSEIKLAPLLKPTKLRPAANIRRNVLRVNDGTGNVTPTGIKYIKKPVKVEWNGFNINNTFMYNAANSTDFELHPSEETKIVMKILQLAAIAMKDPNLYQIATSEDIKNIQQEKQ